MKKLLSILLVLMLVLFALTACGCEHLDKNDDGLCDECGEAFEDGKDIPDAPTCEHRDADDNAKCDKCGADFEDGKDLPDTPACEHVDANKDHACDNGCGQALGTCEDANKDHACDYGCDKAFGTCEDANKDHACDYGCDKILGSCEDKDKDGTCDYGCGKVFTVVYSEGLEFVSNGDDTCYVSDIGTCEDTELVIPPVSPEGDRVTSIGDYAFYDCKNLTSVVIPDSVMSIGVWAFDSCYNLTSIIVSEENTAYQSIDGHLYTKDGKTLIQYAIGRTDTSFVIPDGVETICASVFSDCKHLTSVTIPDSVTSIENYAFYNCCSLASVTIGNAAIVFGTERTYNTRNSFYNCHPSLYTVYESCTYVGDAENPYAILIEATDKNLSTYKLHEDTKIIAYAAFYDCDALISIEIPDGVRAIGMTAFAHCDKLASVVMGADVEILGYGAFDDCTSLESVMLSDSLRCIGDSAFSHCESLASIAFGESVTSIGNRAFEGCNSLTSVEISDSVQTIGEYAFAFCDGLTGVTIGAGVHTIDTAAFCESLALESIVVSAENNAYKAIDGNLYTKDEKTLVQYAIGKTDISFIVPSSVEIIGADAFAMALNLTSITIPSSVKIVSDGAFVYCWNIASITLPDSVKVIGNQVFFGCSLTSVVIGDNVASIGKRAFYWCDSLSKVFYKGDATTWATIEINNDNEELTNATLYYYSEEEPAIAGKFWHYVDGEIEIWGVVHEDANLDHKCDCGCSKTFGTCEDTNGDDYCDYGCGKNFSIVYSEGLEFVSNGDNTCYVSGIGSCEDTELVIPLYSPEGDRVSLCVLCL